VEVKWIALSAHADIRGSPVTSYDLQWDKGTSGLQWESLVGANADSLAIVYIAQSNIIPGKTYQFKVRAQNKWGWGLYSVIKSIKASTWPKIVSKPVTSIEVANGNVLIDWVAPDARSSTISKYKIEIRDGITASSWLQNLQYCDGTNTSIVSATACSVPMS